MSVGPTLGSMTTQDRRLALIELILAVPEERLEVLAAVVGDAIELRDEEEVDESKLPPRLLVKSERDFWDRVHEAERRAETEEAVDIEVVLERLRSRVRAAS